MQFIPTGIPGELCEINHIEVRTSVAGNPLKRIFSTFSAQHCQRVILVRIKSWNPNMNSERMDG